MVRACVESSATFLKDPDITVMYGVDFNLVVRGTGACTCKICARHYIGHPVVACEKQAIAPNITQKSDKFQMRTVGRTGFSVEETLT